MNNSILLSIASKRAKKSNTYLKINTNINKEIMKELNFIKTPFVLIGGWAVNNYMPARQTKDIDILVNKNNKSNIINILKENNGIYLGPLSIEGDSFKINNQEIDVIYCDELWEDIYNSSLIKNNIKVISLGHLIIMKLDASRLQDLADCSRMLGYASEKEVEKVTMLIKKLRPYYLEDYFSLLTLGRLEIQS